MAKRYFVEGTTAQLENGTMDELEYFTVVDRNCGVLTAYTESGKEIKLTVVGGNEYCEMAVLNGTEDCANFVYAWA